MPYTNNGGPQGFSTGVIEGIFRQADERKAKKNQMLQAILADPDAAIAMFGEDLNKVSTMDKVQQLSKQRQEKELLPYVMQLSPETAAGIDFSQPLTAGAVVKGKQGEATIKDTRRKEDISRETEQFNVQAALSNPDIYGRAMTISGGKLTPESVKQAATEVHQEKLADEKIKRQQDISDQIMANTYKYFPDAVFTNPEDIGAVRRDAANYGLGVEKVREGQYDVWYQTKKYVDPKTKKVTSEKIGLLSSQPISAYNPYSYGGGSGMGSTVSYEGPEAFSDPNAWKIITKKQKITDKNGKIKTDVVKTFAPKVFRKIPQLGIVVVGEGAVPDIDNSPILRSNLGISRLDKVISEPELNQIADDYLSSVTPYRLQALQQGPVPVSYSVDKETLKMWNKIDPKGQWLSTTKSQTYEDFVRLQENMSKMFWKARKNPYNPKAAEIIEKRNNPVKKEDKSFWDIFRGNKKSSGLKPLEGGNVNSNSKKSTGAGGGFTIE